jgi:2-hydroxychromene-2-carboxylate isomerase
MFADIARWTRRYGIELNPNPHFPVNTLAAMRTAVAALGEARFADLHRALYRAVWVEGKNVGDDQ